MNLFSPIHILILILLSINTTTHVLADKSISVGGDGGGFVYSVTNYCEKQSEYLTGAEVKHDGNVIQKIRFRCTEQDGKGKWGSHRWLGYSNSNAPVKATKTKRALCSQDKYITQVRGDVKAGVISGLSFKCFATSPTAYRPTGTAKTINLLISSGQRTSWKSCGNEFAMRAFMKSGWSLDNLTLSCQQERVPNGQWDFCCSPVPTGPGRPDFVSVSYRTAGTGSTIGYLDIKYRPVQGYSKHRIMVGNFNVPAENLRYFQSSVYDDYAVSTSTGIISKTIPVTSASIGYTMIVKVSACYLNGVCNYGKTKKEHARLKQASYLAPYNAKNLTNKLFKTNQQGYKLYPFKWKPVSGASGYLLLVWKDNISINSAYDWKQPYRYAQDIDVMRSAGIMRRYARSTSIDVVMNNMDGNRYKWAVVPCVIPRNTPYSDDDKYCGEISKTQYFSVNKNSQAVNKTRR